MNKSLLIVICDFLLLSMLALARFDRTPPEPPKAEAPVTMQQNAAPDLVDTLKASLENEAQQREQMAKQLEARAEDLQNEQSHTQELEQEKSRLEGEQLRLQRLREQLEAQRAELKEQVQQEQEKLKETQTAHQQQLAQTQKEREKMLADIATAQERQRLLQEQLTNRESALEQARSDMRSLEQQKNEVERDRAVLSTRLESAQVAQQRLEGEISTLRTEKDAAHKTAARLAENVGELAQAQHDTQETLKEEIRQVTPLSINTLYDRFRQNRGVLRLNAVESGLLGDNQARMERYTVFVKDASGNVYAIAENTSTPVGPSRLSDLRSLNAELLLPGNRIEAIGQVRYLQADPSIILLPINPATLQEAGIEPYIVEDTPFRFANAVIVTAGGEKYGEVPIRVNPLSKRYIDVENSIANRLFGSFSPTAGDLVFSQNGNLIGLMVGRGRAILLGNLFAGLSLNLGDGFDPQEAKAAATVLVPLLPHEEPAKSNASRQ